MFDRSLALAKALEKEVTMIRKRTIDDWINREAGSPDVDHADPSLGAKVSEKRIALLLNERLPSTRTAPLASHLTPEPGVKVRVEVVTDLLQGKGRSRTRRSGPRTTRNVVEARTSEDMRISARFLVWYGRTLVQKSNGKPLAAPLNAPTLENEGLRTAGLRAIEDAPYIVALLDGSFQGFRRGDEAIRFARRNKGATVHYVSMAYREMKEAAQVLPRPDRARGPSSVLQGQGTKVVRHHVATHLTEARVY
jgi:hypothetical protein